MRLYRYSLAIPPAAVTEALQAAVPEPIPATVYAQTGTGPWGVEAGATVEAYADPETAKRLDSLVCALCVAWDQECAWRAVHEAPDAGLLYATGRLERVA